MTDPWERPGHGPSDPEGYLIEQVPDGYRWTRRADGRTSTAPAERNICSTGPAWSPEAGTKIPI